MVMVDSNPASRAQRTNVSEHVWLRFESALIHTRYTWIAFVRYSGFNASNGRIVETGRIFVGESCAPTASVVPDDFCVASEQ